MNVLLVDPSCFTPPYDHSLAEALVREGSRVTLACSSSPAWTQQASYSRWEHFYHRSSSWGPWRKSPLGKVAKAADHLLCMSSFARRVAELSPDVIHFQWLPLPLVDSYFLPKLRGIAPLVLTLHNTTLFHGSPTSGLQALRFVQAVRHVDAVVVHTEYSRRQVIQHDWAPPERIHVIPHGVLDYYLAAHPAPEASEAPEILFFGNIRPYKGVDLLIRAFTLLPVDLRSTWRLVIAGDPGMDMSGLRSLATAGGVQDRIDWRLGFIPESEIPSLFQRSAVVALPYREIDQSGVLLTTLAFAKPIVATRIGGIPETVQDGVHGLLFDPGDEQALAAALTKLLTDGELRKRMSSAIRDLASGQLQWRSIARKTLALYASLLEARKVGKVN